MKLNQVLQSILIGLILIGLFAMMAHNSYGSSLIGISCFGLALLYFVQICLKLLHDFSGMEKIDVLTIFELGLLALFILLFGFRVFYINLPYSDLIFITICGLLLIVYVFTGSRTYNMTEMKNPLLAKNIILFYTSILIFLLSLGMRIINARLSAITGALAFIAAVPFLISLFRQKKYDYIGKSISLFQFIVATGNKAGMVFMFFIFSVLYVGLTNLRVIPTIENANRPRAYIELITKAETGKEKPINGKYRHEIYKEYMDKFLSRHRVRKAE